MTDEKNLVEVTIRVDMSAGSTLDHVCAKCGKTERSKPVSYDSADYATGKADGEIFHVRSAMYPEGWEHVRITYATGEGTKHVEVCPECIRAFFRWVEAKRKCALCGEPCLGGLVVCYDHAVAGEDGQPANPAATKVR